MGKPSSVLLRLGSGPGAGDGRGDKGRAVSTPSTRGERGPGSWAKFPGTHVPPVPLPALGQGIPQGPGSHRAGHPHLLPREEYTVLTPWGPRELGSTPHISSVSLQSRPAYTFSRILHCGVCALPSPDWSSLCPAAQQVPLVELGKLFRALGGRRGSSLQTHPSLTIRPLLTSWPPLVDAPGLSLWFIAHSCLNTLPW